jgi:hypothetical protein
MSESIIYASLALLDHLSSFISDLLSWFPRAVVGRSGYHFRIQIIGSQPERGEARRIYVCALPPCLAGWLAGSYLFGARIYPVPLNLLLGRLANIYCELSMLIIHIATRNLLCSNSSRPALAALVGFASSAGMLVPFLALRSPDRIARP